MSAEQEQTLVVTLTVNGAPRTAETRVRTLLSDFLRDELGLKGTNVGCEHGYCGACTVLLNGESVRSCLILAPQAEGAHITTVEGLADEDGLSPLQKAFQDAHGLQCGFCTPGVLVSATELLNRTSGPLSDETIRTALSGNICRCTGYVHIIDAVRSAAETRPE